MDEALENPAGEDTSDAPMARMLAVVDTDRLDIAALIWMVGVLVFVACEVCFALLASSSAPFRGADGNWDRIQQLGSTVDFGILCALVIGIAVSAAFDSALSRAAALLGIIGGAWALVAGFLRILYQAAAPNKTQVHGQAVFVYGSGFVVAVLGALILIAAFRLYSTVRYDTELIDEDALEPDEL